MAEQTDDRKELTEITKQIKALNKRVHEITYSNSKVPYGKVIQNILRSYIKSKPEYSNLCSVDQYKIYQKLHLEISRELGIGTKQMTRQEALAAINIISKYYDVREYYERYF